ncbi:hypothetical protein [Escherichia coli]|uniref:hypothetical protein n=1 Tax=Escherichia coli TaxID=562 RepID=UPI0002A3067B|nr:hypothetical protein [Escherichia coli]EKW75695.1 hypothetical protein EC970007_3375 [Escherichia coli 97.0007]
MVNNAVKIGRTILTAWIKQVPDLLFSYLHLTLSGVFQPQSIKKLLDACQILFHLRPLWSLI